jgi:hypothetical protein
MIDDPTIMAVPVGAAAAWAHKHRAVTDGVAAFGGCTISRRSDDGRHLPFVATIVRCRSVRRDKLGNCPCVQGDSESNRGADTSLVNAENTAGLWIEDGRPAHAIGSAHIQEQTIYSGTVFIGGDGRYVALLKNGTKSVDDRHVARR